MINNNEYNEDKELHKENKEGQKFVSFTPPYKPPKVRTAFPGSDGVLKAPKTRRWQLKMPIFKNLFLKNKEDIKCLDQTKIDLKEK